MPQVLAINTDARMFSFTFAKPPPTIPLDPEIVMQEIKLQSELDMFKVPEQIAEYVQRRFVSTSRLFVACYQAQVVSMSLLNPDHKVGRMLYGNFTVPEFRGRYINAGLMAFILKTMKREGAKEILVSCHRDNASSKAAILRAGFTELGILQRLERRIRRWVRSPQE
ncbi:MAG: GNAT family N-acetyltransferase [Candidatus Omnitrophica bacterium]|nr:GNAT family N-acetyltransferase [Candidatus Omnitrophota bacterium]